MRLVRVKDKAFVKIKTDSFYHIPLVEAILLPHHHTGEQAMCNPHHKQTRFYMLRKQA